MRLTPPGLSLRNSPPTQSPRFRIVPCGSSGGRRLPAPVMPLHAVPHQRLVQQSTSSSELSAINRDYSSVRNCHRERAASFNNLSSQLSPGYSPGRRARAVPARPQPSNLHWTRSLRVKNDNEILVRVVKGHRSHIG